MAVPTWRCIVTPKDHHAFWRDQIGDHPLLEEPGCFGTNLAMTGLTEGEVLVGARFRLGSALLEACQPRQPCSTIEQHFAHPGMVKSIVANGRCGWFFRVLEEGVAEAGDRLTLLEGGTPAGRCCASSTRSTALAAIDR
jgi:MOSC domain-containing protein YiiM